MLIEEQQKEIEGQLNIIYTRFENDPPPMTWDRNENNYNKGFYAGRLNAMEIIVKALTGKSGDMI